MAHRPAGADVRAEPPYTVAFRTPVPREPSAGAGSCADAALHAIRSMQLSWSAAQLLRSIGDQALARRGEILKPRRITSYLIKRGGGTRRYGRRGYGGAERARIAAQNCRRFGR